MSVQRLRPVFRARSEEGYRFPALAWALLHVPVILALYSASIRAAVHATPARWQGPLWPTFVPQAALLALVAFVIALPFSIAPRVYRIAAPLAAGLVTAALALDSRVYGAVGFHLNGFFFRVLLQPNALRETGVPLSDVAIFVAGAVVAIAVEVLVGSRFISWAATKGRRAWPWALALVLLSTAERFYGGALVYFGGPAIFAASTVLPLQVPIRIGKFMSTVLGQRAPQDAFAGKESMRLPTGVSPKEMHLARRPDVLFVIAESLPANHLDARTMPNLWRRAHEEGALFTRHYSAASSTNYTVFSLMYGLQAQKLEATVGGGRRPVLFPALEDNGYQLRLLAASCVDWMGLKDTVFGGVHEDLLTWCDKSDPATRDPAMLASAREFVEKADDRPIFMFLFFFGTHFNYFHAPEDAVFTPEWDGSGVLKATGAPADLIENRSRNAAHAVDRELEQFLTFFEQKRGKTPLVVFTGDHGEEFRQKGHIGHGSDVTSEQIHVPAVWLGPGVPRGERDVVTNHVDIVPTLFALLGDTHAPGLYADGMDMFEVAPDRFVVSTVGWEPRYAAIGRDLKVKMYAGLAGADITDPEDRPIPDGATRMAASAGKILKALRGESEPAPAQHAAAAAQPAAAP